MVVEVVCEMVWDKVFPGHSQVYWVPPLKLCTHLVQLVFGDFTFLGERSILEENVIPYVRRHVRSSGITVQCNANKVTDT